ncbi:ATP-dependent DNA helicase RecG [Rickettsiales endosymbiont of Peranema trichophorum]|uniref:ATP-dependent DNA helicase RecG n=1 Tax=Rickettsiales endosymbiont of Peranema trichophorum TaxID=2486577 RepID=UPI001022C860|nr:ATP-dependent DNA helicase RecG [Rickettsiales endosymbiont of Peranema trichophorum]RZI46779.1 ATP-dependent DNA helicase RecG [Rickettsiales endosymbiont of Peranema trichophorum]
MHGDSLHISSSSICYLSSDIGDISGIGLKTAQAYKRLGCITVRDLLLHLPYSTIDRRDNSPLYSIKTSQITTQLVCIRDIKIPNYKYSKKRNTPYVITCDNSTGRLLLLYFNIGSEYLKKLLYVGNRIVVSGKIELVGGNLQMVHPDVVTSSKTLAEVRIIEPLYRSTYGLTNSQIRSTIARAIRNVGKLPEWIPHHIMSRYSWVTWLESIRKAHFPDNVKETEWSLYRDRLAFDELFAQQLTLQLIRQGQKKHYKTPLCFCGVLLNRLLRILPFELTEDQKSIILDIAAEQLSKERVMRLVLGDVGCGKTIIAVCAMLNAIEAGKQAVLMAPTAVLARQHFLKIQALCQAMKVTCGILISDMPQGESREVRKQIKEGSINLIIGTHALFQNAVVFQNLGLVIIDEQHRFGVEQRLALLQKSNAADFLMMSATPIPRTLCMVNYGDLDLSIVKEKPKSRATVHTKVIADDKVDEVMYKLKHAMENGDKVYWICPLVEESEKLDLMNIKERFGILNGLFPNVVGVVHGQMPSAERDKAMLDFLNGATRILVATSIIEVGIDVSDATIMIIEHAERFGLSQLHQLRGRIGRGSATSYCILLYKKPLSNIASERLGIVRNSNSGFEIAAEDLKIRGGGDILGIKQSGVPEFKVCDIVQHQHLVEQAHRSARSAVAIDPQLELPEHRSLKVLIDLYSTMSSELYTT